MNCYLLIILSSLNFFIVPSNPCECREYRVLSEERILTNECKLDKKEAAIHKEVTKLMGNFDLTSLRPDTLIKNALPKKYQKFLKRVHFSSGLKKINYSVSF
jgi:hypothetical protein